MCVYRGVANTILENLIYPRFRFGSRERVRGVSYLSQLVPVIFTYLDADCPCDIT